MIRVDEEQDCPTNDYEPGEAIGKCWGDGHHNCQLCKHFRADFKANTELREFALDIQGGIQFDVAQPLRGLSV